MANGVKCVRIITTHLHADFDCLASMVAARKIYPDATLVFPGAQEKNVRDYLSTAEHSVLYSRLKQIDLDAVRAVIVVDTSSRERIGPFAKLIENPDVLFTIYDHHPSLSHDILGATAVIRKRGATSTIMVELLREREIIPTRDEATLLMLGLYEDTGSLTFPSVTKEDYQAAAWLLGQGANLETVARYQRRELSAPQIAILNSLLQSIDRRSHRGLTLAIATASAEPFGGDVADMTHKLMDMEPVAVLVTLVRIDDHIHLVARSRGGAIDVGAVAHHFGGGGHPTAASATIKGEPLPQVVEKLWEKLFLAFPAFPRVEELMERQVTSVAASEPISAAKALMTRYAIGALPVMEAGRVVGIVTRPVVERALHHTIDHHPVTDVMNIAFETLAPGSGAAQLEAVFLARKQKLAPVLAESGEMVGVLTRGMAIDALYGAAAPRASRIGTAHRRHTPVIRDVSRLLTERLPEEMTHLLNIAKDLGDKSGCGVYAVGGFVRDILLSVPTVDLDLVVEGDGVTFARELAGRLEARARIHQKFHTAVVVLPDGRKIDVATARREYYAHPGALPSVESSAIRNDLQRRDFSINAMAIRLNGPHPNRLIDYFGGQTDLKDHLIRVLHNLSFVEDPTRAFRAVRFEVRYGISIGKQTLALLKAAVRGELFHRLSPSRLFTELRLILEEENRVQGMERLLKLDLLRFVHPGITFGDRQRKEMNRCRDLLAWWALTFPDEPLRRWLPPLLLLFETLTEDEVAQLHTRFPQQERLMAELLTLRRRLVSLHLLFTHAGGGALPPLSEVDLRCRDIPPEGLLYAAARENDERAERSICAWLTEARGTPPWVTGADLLGIGLTPSPLFGSLLDRIRAAQLDRRVTDREGALRLLRSLVERSKKE